MAVSFNKPLVIGFLPGFLYLVMLIKNKGLSKGEIWEVCKKGIKKARTVIMILLLVSFILPSWYKSGTIEQLVSISLYIIIPEYFFLLTFIISMCFSMLLGTSVGTLSAVGIPIMSSAIAINLPPEIVAGALISGAFVGDRTSPFSSAHQLLAQTVEVSVKKQFLAMFIPTIVAVFIGAAFFIILDFLHEITVYDVSSLEQLSLITFFPPIVLVGLVLLRISIIYSFLFSIIVAILISFGKGVTFIEILYSLIFGVNGVGGGLANMYLLLLFLVLAGAYNGLIEEFRVIQPFLDNWLQHSRSLIEDTLKTTGASFGISLIAANQTLPIILTGRSFLPHWRKKQRSEELARVMADTTMLFPGMIPWSVLAIMCSTIVGVPIITYLPYAIFLWVLPIITLVISIIKQFLYSNKSTSKDNKSSKTNYI